MCGAASLRSSFFAARPTVLVLAISALLLRNIDCLSFHHGQLERPGHYSEPSAYVQTYLFTVPIIFVSMLTMYVSCHGQVDTRCHRSIHVSAVIPSICMCSSSVSNYSWEIVSSFSYDWNLITKPVPGRSLLTKIVSPDVLGSRQ